MHAVIFCCRRDKTVRRSNLTHDSLWECEQVHFKYTRQHLNTKNSVKPEESKNLTSQRQLLLQQHPLNVHCMWSKSAYSNSPLFQEAKHPILIKSQTLTAQWMGMVKCTTGQGLWIKDAGPCNSWCWFYCLITSVGQTAVDQDNINSADRTEQPLMWCCA